MRRSPGPLALLTLVLCSCGEPEAKVAIPDPDTSGMEKPVASTIAAARAAVVAAPRSADAWGRMGIACQAHGLAAPAETCYRIAADLDPADVRWVYFRAVALHARHAPGDEVIPLFESACAMRPDASAIRVRLADALSELGRREDAAAAYREALRLDPDLARAHFALGRLHISMGRADDAITHLERADELQPGHGAIRAALAQAYARAGRGDEARAIAARAGDPATTVMLPDPLLQELAMAAVSSEQCMDRAMQLMTRGRYDLALRDLQIVESARGPDAAVQLHLGRSLHLLGRTEEAEPHLRRAVELDDGMAAAHHRLGALLLDTGRHDEAMTHLHRARRLEPSYAPAAWKLAAALAMTGQMEPALDVFDDAGRIGGGKARDHLNWGLALYQSRRPAEAADRFVTSIELDPDNADAHCLLGVSLETQGRTEDARREYLEAVRLDPQNVARKHLERMGYHPQS